MHSGSGHLEGRKAYQAGNQSDASLSEGMVQLLSCVWCAYLLIIWIGIQSLICEALCVEK